MPVEYSAAPVPPRCGETKLSPGGGYLYHCTLALGHARSTTHRWSDATPVIPDLTDATAVAEWLD